MVEHSINVVSSIADRITVLQRGAIIADGPYGESHILHGVNLSVNEGEVVTLLGRNGAGRTTTLRAIVAMTGTRKGSIKIRSQEIIKLAPHKVAGLGVGYCPEERGIFASLSAVENLMLPPVIAPDGMPLAEIYQMFPNLQERASSPGTRAGGAELPLCRPAGRPFLHHGARHYREAVCAKRTEPEHGHVARLPRRLSPPRRPPKTSLTRRNHETHHTCCRLGT